MYYYEYSQDGTIINKHTTKPNDIVTLEYDNDLDITNYVHVVSLIKDGKILGINSPIPKPTEILIGNINKLNETIVKQQEFISQLEQAQADLLFAIATGGV